MRRVFGVAGYIFFLFLMSACGQEEEEINFTDFRYDIVTCRHDGDDLVFLRDDTTLLYPQSAVPSHLLPIDQRALIGYSPVGKIADRQLSIVLQTSIKPITTGDILFLSPDGAQELADDPLYLTSVWCSGGYANLRYKIEYHDVSHVLTMIAVFPQNSTDTLDLQLRHDTRGDAPGYYASGYASFRLPRPLPPVVRVSIHTSNLDGRKQFVFTEK